MCVCVCAPVQTPQDRLSIFTPLQANCCGEAAGFEVIRSCQVDEQNGMSWKNTDF